ncbi:AAA domain-containing protein [Ruegeria sp. WL0004]|uniref:AAA domain-containing protein n=1 Tax=Ruegeria marisflavi TaxID=2984152 RepID=A0ABT2WWY1_9RHOB|nr:AAA domain-containing protein [Ruegeria sp. WL0004]MCU9840416.1 AAA domain-containing protein [Ruegeria sp. WL0004]
MRVTNLGEGIHQREIKGVEILQKNLPRDWYAYTNLEFVVGAGATREIDVVIVAPERIFVVDLKDWNGTIEATNGRWTKDGRDHGPSPVPKVSENARQIGTVLGQFVRKNSGGQRIPSPFVHGAVVMTGNADIRGIAPSELRMVHTIDDFLKKLVDEKKREEVFGKPRDAFYKYKLSSQDWKSRLSKFFNVRASHFEPGRRRFGEFVSSGQVPEFSHSAGVFSEYEASSTISKSTVGTLRLWDFTRADARFQNKEARSEIAGRERRVCDFLTEVEEDFPTVSLRTRVEDLDFAPDYWEVYERRNDLKRLSEIPSVTIQRKSVSERTELARQVVSKVAILHRQSCSHLDLGEHSVWVQEPHTVRLSHFMSAAIPDEQTLGASRFHFLSSAQTPEDIYGQESTGQRKDLYLLGLVVHRLLFGVLPQKDSSDGTMSWDASIDADGEFPQLHGWLKTCLELDPLNRFPSAVEALEEFGEASKDNNWNTEIAAGLERYSSEFRSVFELISTFPMSETVLDSPEKALWRSETKDGQYLVKLWKSACWGDLKKDALRILRHLNSLDELRAAELPFVPKIKSVHWMGDHIGLVQEWIEGETLSDLWQNKEASERSPAEIAEQVTTAVLRLHEKDVGHGDLKPSNILVPTNEFRSVQLLDIIDFRHADDGDIRNSEYSREGQDAFQRDCYAVSKIVCELAEYFTEFEVKQRVLAGVPKLIDPENHLVDLERVLELLNEPAETNVDENELKIEIGIKDVEAHKIATDEGQYFVRPLYNNSGWAVRGATEQIIVFHDDSGKISNAIVRSVSQGQIARFGKFEVGAFAGQIQIKKSSINELLQLETIQDAFANELSHAEAEQPEHFQEDNEFPKDDTEDSSSTEEELDALEELIAAQHSNLDLSYVDRLWQQFLKLELEQQVTAVATDDAYLDPKDNSVRIPYEMRTGTLDFPPSDTIFAEAHDAKRGRWHSLGRLDLEKTNSEVLVLDSRFGKDISSRRNGRVAVRDNQTIRLLSHFEETSRLRRREAIERILSKRSENPYLRDVFCGHILSPMKASLPDLNFEQIQKKHSLNQSQISALKNVFANRPVGILQGPPGTGKTKFIAALVQCALDAGVATNVLVASQSHEAVNNAADAILESFGDEDPPSLLRVGHEGQISGRLRRFSSRSLEEQKREKFSATLDAKIKIAAAMTDMKAEKAREILKLETSIKPLIEKLFSLSGDPGSVSGSSESDAKLMDRTIRHLERALVSYDLELLNEFDTTLGETTFLLELRSSIAEQLDISLSKYQIVADVAELIRDFKNSVSTGNRNFDAFFAGTRQVVAGTCVGLGRSSLGLTKTPFDLVVIDEAARCSASELAVPMQAGRWIVLVGDQAQLEPLHDQSVVRGVSKRLGIEEREAQRSDFERLFQSSYGSEAASLLATQYRMLPPIGDIVSQAFYSGRLRHGRTEPILKNQAKPICLDRSMYWIPTESEGKNSLQRKSGTSWENQAEADVIANLLRVWSDSTSFISEIKDTGLEFPIGIICMYAAQRNLIRSTLMKTDISADLRKLIRIDTVDSYQGKQNLVVLLSLVRHNQNGPKQNGAPTIKEGFMARDNRVNVAFSRAMDNLIIVGAREGWPAEGPIGRVRDLFNRKLESGSVGLATPSEIQEYLMQGVNA